MSSIGILTDSTALLSTSPYPGHEFVSVIPLRVQVDQAIYPDSRDLKLYSQFFSHNGHLPVALSPSVEDFCQTFLALGQKYQVILTILLSSRLNSAVQNAQEAASLVRGSTAIHIVDSQTTAAGLGFLVQAAAEAIQKGKDETHINSLVRGLIPHIYTVFCLQSLSYLAASNQIDSAQALIGEMLGVIPFYIMEGGRLIPIQKARSPRHLVDMLHEFVAEFDNLKNVAIVQGIPPFEQEARNLRERLYQDISPEAVSEHNLSLALMALIGPHSFGVFALEDWNPED
jgi:DegV family protein with EDD domain